MMTVVQRSIIQKISGDKNIPIKLANVQDECYNNIAR